MDSMYAVYFEETEELLQRAEECLIRLEAGPSAEDIHELFRIAHSIKGSSQMVGYDRIGNLTHKVEDLLDSVRKGRLQMDREILRLCFEGLDQIKRMVEARKTSSGGELDPGVAQVSERLEKEIERILANGADAPAGLGGVSSGGGIVQTLRQKETAADRRVYVSIYFSEDAPMIQAVLYKIFHNIREIGSLEYSNISDDDIFAASPNRPVTSCHMVLHTDLEPAEMYPYFEVMYVDKVSIVDVSDSHLRGLAAPQDQRSLAFFEMWLDEWKKIRPLLCRPHHENRARLGKMLREQAAKILEEGKRLPSNAMLPHIEDFYDQCLFLLAEKTKFHPETAGRIRREHRRLLEKVYAYIRGKLIYKIVRARDQHFRKRLNDAVEQMDRSLVRTVFVDVSGKARLDPGELAELIRVKRDLGASGISMAIIAGVPQNKRLVNVLDAIQSVEPFPVYGTELDAVLGG